MFSPFQVYVHLASRAGCSPTSETQSGHPSPPNITAPRYRAGAPTCLPGAYNSYDSLHLFPARAPLCLPAS